MVKLTLWVLCIGFWIWVALSLFTWIQAWRWVRALTALLVARGYQPELSRTIAIRYVKPNYIIGRPWFRHEDVSEKEQEFIRMVEEEVRDASGDK